MDPQLLATLLSQNPQAIDMFLASQGAVMPGRQSDESPFTKGSERALEAVAKSRIIRKEFETIDKEERAQAVAQGLSKLGLAMLQTPVTGKTILPMLGQGLAGYNEAISAIQQQKARDYEMAMQQQQKEHEKRQQMLLHLLPYMQMTAAQQEAARRAQQQQALMQQRATLPYEKMTKYQEGLLEEKKKHQLINPAHINRLRTLIFNQEERMNKALGNIQENIALSPSEKERQSAKIVAQYTPNINKMKTELEKINSALAYTGESPLQYNQSIDEDAEDLATPISKPQSSTERLAALENKEAMLQQRLAQLQ